MDTKKTYFICSYGGSGSKMLTGFIRNYYEALHVHDRCPPDELTMPGKFNKIKIENTFGKEKVDPNLYRVIFIFRSPIDAYLSRGSSLQHCKNIDGYYRNHIKDRLTYVKSGVDIMRYNEHFHNYAVRGNKKYDIICINYHKIWENLEEILTVLEIPLSEIKNFPPKRVKEKQVDAEILTGLNYMYHDLLEKIKQMPAIKIV